jgi:hypothetical protein
MREWEDEEGALEKRIVAHCRYIHKHAMEI